MNYRFKYEIKWNTNSIDGSWELFMIPRSNTFGSAAYTTTCNEAGLTEPATWNHIDSRFWRDTLEILHRWRATDTPECLEHGMNDTRPLDILLLSHPPFRHHHPFPFPCFKKYLSFFFKLTCHHNSKQKNEWNYFIDK